MVELVSRQGRVGADVLSLRPIVRAAYPGECDFSIGFLHLLSKPESREYGFTH
jgi:hypothetical protein